MANATTPDSARIFSITNLADQASTDGWVFWRGYVVGMLALIAVTLPALDVLS